jgi:hypothetical protein
MGDKFEPGAFIVVIVVTAAGVTRNPKNFKKGPATDSETGSQMG